MSEEFSTTRMVFEIEATTAMGPEAAINMVKAALQFPAIKGVSCVKAETNFRLHQEPGENFVPYTEGQSMGDWCREQGNK
jgi:hypothetical protein